MINVFFFCFYYVFNPDVLCAKTKQPPRWWWFVVVSEALVACSTHTSTSSQGLPAAASVLRTPTESAAQTKKNQQDWARQLTAEHPHDERQRPATSLSAFPRNGGHNSREDKAETEEHFSFPEQPTSLYMSSLGNAKTKTIFCPIRPTCKLFYLSRWRLTDCCCYTSGDGRQQKNSRSRSRSRAEQSRQRTAERARGPSPSPRKIKQALPCQPA